MRSDRRAPGGGGPGSAPDGRLPSRREVIALGVGIFVVGAVPLVRRVGRPGLVRRRLPAMGTVAEVSVLHRDEAYAQRAIHAALEQIRRTETLLTRFSRESDIGRVNAAAPGQAVPVDPEAADVLDAALLLASATDGRFDPCLGGATNLWDARGRIAPPPEWEIEPFADERLFQHLEVDRAGGETRVRGHHPGLSLDLGAIGKGWGVDRAVTTLRDWGITSGLVNLGGDLYALGTSPDGDPWRVGVRDPDNPAGVVAELALSEEALATSGDYERFFVHAGRRYHHILDPRTGRPARTATRSVTVADSRCWRADAVATALFGASAEEHESLIRRSAPDARLVHRVAAGPSLNEPTMSLREEPAGRAPRPDSRRPTPSYGSATPGPETQLEDRWKNARPSAATAIKTSS